MYLSEIADKALEQWLAALNRGDVRLVPKGIGGESDEEVEQYVVQGLSEFFWPVVRHELSRYIDPINGEDLIAAARVVQGKPRDRRAIVRLRVVARQAVADWVREVAPEIL